MDTYYIFESCVIVSINGYFVILGFTDTLSFCSDVKEDRINFSVISFTYGHFQRDRFSRFLLFSYKKWKKSSVKESQPLIDSSQSFNVLDI